MRAADILDSRWFNEAMEWFMVGLFALIGLLLLGGLVVGVYMLFFAPKSDPSVTVYFNERGCYKLVTVYTGGSHMVGVIGRGGHMVRNTRTDVVSLNQSACSEISR